MINVSILYSLPFFFLSTLSYRDTFAAISQNPVPPIRLFLIQLDSRASTEDSNGSPLGRNNPLTPLQIRFM